MRAFRLALMILTITLLACSLTPIPAVQQPLANEDPLETPASVVQIDHTPTATPTPSATATATPTDTPAPTSTATDTPQPTATKMATPRPTPSPSPTPEPEEAAVQTGLISADLVNLRSGPGTQFEIVGSLILSETVEIVGRDEAAEWWQICCPVANDQPSWIIAEFVEPEFNPAEAEAQIPLAGTTTLISDDDSQATGIVIEDLVNIRSGPGTDFAVVGGLILSQTVQIIGQTESADWWQICCPDEGDPAWVIGEYVEANITDNSVPITFGESQEPDIVVASIADKGIEDIDQSRVIDEDLIEKVEVEASTIEAEDDVAVNGEVSGDEAAILSPEALPAAEAAEPVVAEEEEAQSLNTKAIPDIPPAAIFEPTQGANPLTGLPLAADQQGQRPVVVCINNDPGARPQFGTSQADIMYEYLMEGLSITRFSGLFYGDTAAQIGPVRSARLINYYLGSLYNAPLFCSGASDQVRYLLKNESPFPYLDVDLDDPANRLYSDSVGTNYRTRLRTSTAGLRQWLIDWEEEQPATIRGFTFGPLVADGLPAQNIDIPYPTVTGSQVTYHYDAASGRYLRYLGDAPHTDGNTGTQLALDNVIVQYVEHQATDIVEDSLGSTSIRLNLFGQNRALLFRDGVSFEGTWQSTGPGDMPHFFDQNGVEVPLKPGKIWISVVPERYEIVYSP